VSFQPNREELAWAAGFFDGEGSFSWTEAAAFGCTVINQANKEPLERFQRAVAGLGKIYWAVRNATQGPLVTKAAMGVQGSSSRARTGDRRDAVVQARLYQEAAGGRGAQTLSKQMPSRSSQESRSPRLPSVR